MVVLWYQGSVYPNCCFSDSQKAFYCNCFSKLMSCLNASLGPICFLFWISGLFWFEEANRSIFFLSFSNTSFWSLLFLVFLCHCGHQCYLPTLKKNSQWSVCLWNNNCSPLFCSSYRRVPIPEWSLRCYHNVNDIIISKDSSVLVMPKCIFTD